MTVEQSYCYRCGTPMESAALFCYGCGAASLTNKGTAPPPVLLLSLVAVAIAVAAVYFLVLRGSGGTDGGVSENVLLEDLAIEAPPGWKSLFDAPDRFTFALTDEDLTLPLPLGPRIIITRDEEASVNFPARVTADIDADDVRDRIKNGGRYGVGGQLTGSEIRFVRRMDGEEDYVERHLYLRGADVAGPAFDIIFLVPEADEDLHNDTFNDLLESLELHTGE